MKNKIIIISIVFAFSLTGCEEQTGLDKDLLRATPVESLYAPNTGQAVVLQTIPGAALRFEWAPARSADGGPVQYEIAFDRTNGDFSNPIYRAPSGDNGSATSVAVTHRQLNEIAALVGIGQSQEGSLKWTVFASRAVDPVIASVVGEISVVRHAGFIDLPGSLYITGAATGSPTAIEMDEISNAESSFEVYTRITAGQTFSFVEQTSGASRQFYIDGNEIKEGTGGTYTVETTGVYHFYLDFITGAFTASLELSHVESLGSPSNNHAEVLQLEPGVNMQFLWETATTAERYEILFDLVDGDFSDPIFRMNAGVSGVAISHRQMNTIATLAGADISQPATFKWTVFTSRGRFGPYKAVEERNITVTRLGGFSTLPEELYITGAATEDVNPIEMKKIGDGEFEIFTKLEAGQTFNFVDNSSQFYLDGIEIKQGAGTYTVPKTGVYHFYLDFRIAVFTAREILRVAFFNNGSQVNFWLPYQGMGVWGSTIVMEYDIITGNPEIATTTSGNAPTDLPYTGTSLSDDDRYKFRMVSQPLGSSSEVVTEWRAFNFPSDWPPGPNPTPDYWWMIERTNVAQWTNNEIWKLNSRAWIGHTFEITFELKGDEPYTHTLVRTVN